MTTVTVHLSPSPLMLWHPLLPYGYSYQASCVTDRVKPSFVIFDIWALWRSGLSTRVPGCKKNTNDDLTRSGTVYPYGNSGRQRFKQKTWRSSIHFCTTSTPQLNNKDVICCWSSQLLMDLLVPLTTDQKMTPNHDIKVTFCKWQLFRPSRDLWRLNFIRSHSVKHHGRNSGDITLQQVLFVIEKLTIFSTMTNW